MQKTDSCVVRARGFVDKFAINPVTRLGLSDLEPSDEFRRETSYHVSDEFLVFFYKSMTVVLMICLLFPPFQIVFLSRDDRLIIAERLRIANSPLKSTR
jgi:hypothetical protein